MLPLACGAPSSVAPQERDWDILLTAETHNFPCAVAPYPGVPLELPMHGHITSIFSERYVWEELPPIVTP